MTRRRAVSVAGIVLLLLATLFVFFHSKILLTLGHFLVLDSTPQIADAALVLAGDSRGARIKAASELVRNGFVPVVLVSGPMELYGVNEATLAIDFAVRSGYPRSWYDPIVIRALSTEEEARAFIPELRRRNVRKLLLVTSNYHTRRAAEVFRWVLPKDIEMHVIAAPDKYFNPNNWWQSREGQKIWFFETSKTFAEWVGL